MDGQQQQQPPSLPPLPQRPPSPPHAEHEEQGKRKEAVSHCRAHGCESLDVISVMPVIYGE